MTGSEKAPDDYFQAFLIWNNNNFSHFQQNSVFQLGYFEEFLLTQNASEGQKF